MTTFAAFAHLLSHPGPNYGAPTETPSIDQLPYKSSSSAVRRMQSCRIVELIGGIPTFQEHSTLNSTAARHSGSEITLRF